MPLSFSCGSQTSQVITLPFVLLIMMTSSLTAGWQQQEVLHMVITNLDPYEQYFLAALLLVSLLAI